MPTRPASRLTPTPRRGAASDRFPQRAIAIVLIVPIRYRFADVFNFNRWLHANPRSSDHFLRCTGLTADALEGITQMMSAK